MKASCTINLALRFESSFFRESFAESRIRFAQATNLTAKLGDNLWSQISPSLQRSFEACLDPNASSVISCNLDTPPLPAHFVSDHVPPLKIPVPNLHMVAQHRSHSALPQLNARRLRPLLAAKLNLRKLIYFFWRRSNEE